MSEWSPDPPTEPGRYWRVTRHSCGKCWSEPYTIDIVEGLGVNAPLEERGERRFAIGPPTKSLWGPKIEDPEPPETPK